MSKVLTEDCMTQATKWSNCITKFKKSHQSVRFDENQKNEKNSIEIGNTNEKTQLSVHEMAWDNDTDNNGIGGNNTEAYLDDFSLIKPEFVINNQSKLTQNNLYEEEENEPLTSEKLDQTFNNDYFRLYYPSSSIITDSANQTILNRFVDEQIKKIESLNESGQIQLIERTVMNLSRPNKTLINQTIVEEPGIKEVDLEERDVANDKQISEETNSKEEVALPPVVEFSNLNETNVVVDTKKTKETMNLTTLIMENDRDVTYNDCATTFHESASNLNETIIQAVRDPFNFDIKLRLLERGPINQLKAKSCFKSLCTLAPIINTKTPVQLNDNESYSVLNQIGKGAYAQIYLIQNKSNKEKKYALKVDRQATAWEFYTTEVLNERLAGISKEGQMLIDVSKSFVKIQQFMKYSNGCFSAMNYYEKGSLLVKF